MLFLKYCSSLKQKKVLPKSEHVLLFPTPKFDYLEITILLISASLQADKIISLFCRFFTFSCLRLDSHLISEVKAVGTKRKNLFSFNPLLDFLFPRNCLGHGLLMHISQYIFDWAGFSIHI